jgi:predicted GNAT superfamily acetyltransferase
MTAGVYAIRPLHDLDDCLRVVELEKQIWQYPDAEDVVPAAILLVSIKRGGILLGAFEPGSDRLAGFVYSLAAFRDGKRAQWSHMLGVLPEARGAGLGAELKKAQRRAALAMDVTLIEWTFDPLQALNAHLNFAKLGTVAEEYLENVYGDSASPLHEGTPTDRLVALWRLDAPHVARRLAGPALPVRDAGAYDAPAVLMVEPSGGRLGCSGVDTDRQDRRLSIEIPMGFPEIQARDPELALAWRLATREAFSAYFAQGYRAVDFFLDRAQGRGRYLLARDTPP